ncbi:MAG TPA: hypothetical protein VMT35_17140 [Ignavibacteriaceae bacterium]|nr:hypothetical protein [Ignavibacteriaceae bacterium]
MLNRTLSLISVCLLLLNIHCSQNINSLNDEAPTFTLSQQGAQFSNDGKKIVFYGSYESIYAIHFVDVNGNYLGHILSNTDVSFPTWSPDNQEITVLMGGVEGHLYNVKINGDSLKKLSDNPAGYFCNWSPDGRYIAYTKSICIPECGIEIYDFKDNTQKFISQNGLYPSWGRDSKRVYYYTYSFITNNLVQSGDIKGAVFRRVDVNKLNEDSLFYVKSSDNGLFVQSCAISTDENEILFAASSGSSEQMNIWKITLKNGDIIQLTYDGGTYPSYNPTNDKIVYTNSNINEGGLWIMNSDGSNKQRLTKFQR